MDDTVKFGVRMKRVERVTNYHQYKVEVYCQVLDLVIQEIENRFPEQIQNICMNCLSPRNSFASFNIDKLVRLAELYPDDFSCTECMALSYQLKTYISNIVDKVEFSNIEDLGNLAKILVATTRDKAFPLNERWLDE
ncbi:uncharacterized protein LOC121781592 [Salvia splendens]|uniref:uncharacterized protein LOC121781592 n=1 Tax=Salvia splendens TaxID=180675 RepID=UPI001C277291|nr:uncharacterized protein LOC121781592 [Salvia splendens]